MSVGLYFSPQLRLHGHCFSLHFNGHFPGEPGLTGTRLSPFWILLELRVMEVVVTTGAIGRAAADEQSKYLIC